MRFTALNVKVHRICGQKSQALLSVCIDLAIILTDILTDFFYRLDIYLLVLSTR